MEKQIKIRYIGNSNNLFNLKCQYKIKQNLSVFLVPKSMESRF
jgi:hypothetical protein